MPSGTRIVVNGRTLEQSHARLNELLEVGQSVLDVGCATGAITRDIAERVLQWLAAPQMALLSMVQTVRVGGRVIVLDYDFVRRIGIWAEVAASRGHQMVADGFVREAQRAAAEVEYRLWIEGEDEVQEMHLVAVEGVRVL
ncbi:MAG: SAM-dependent methyltransferase [Candidatus Latescibacterota bacterium]|jgi:SAM-dependent methyltransferase